MALSAGAGGWAFGRRAGVTPGAVNAHTHLYSALAPFGMPTPRPAPRDFPEILRAVWWRLDRALDPAALAAGARWYAAEALLAGTTALIDHHESPSAIDGSLDVLADACDAIGIRAVLCYGATERNRGRDEARAGLAECRRFARDNRRPNVRSLVGLHASFTVSDETLDEAARTLGDLDTVMHVHLAEDRCDVEDARTRGYAGPLERLLAHATLPAGSIVAHGVHLDRAQVARLDQAGVWLVQNPRSNRHNRVGYPAALSASGRVALGTDGFPADLAIETAALLELAASEHDPADRTALFGRAEAGRRLVSERFGGDALAGDQVTFGDPGADGRAPVERVTVGGVAVVEGGRLVRADLAELRARAREAAATLWPRMERLPWPD